MDIPVAILDDGVRSSVLRVPHVQSRSTFVTDDRDSCITGVTHGSICAAIIEMLHPGISIHDIKVLTARGSGYRDNLITGLEWCLHNSIKVVHLSLGSVEYHDALPLYRTTQKLIERNTVVVAAFSNRNIPTFPAIFPGVFGVRCCEHGLDKATYAYKENDWLRGSNAWVASPPSAVSCITGGTIQVLPSNSFAAPVITASILKILSRNPDVSHDKIQMFLREGSKTIGESESRDTFNSFDWADSLCDSAVYVQISESNSIYIEDATKYLQRNGYAAEAIGRETGIPFSLYFRPGSVSKNAVKGLSILYHVDVMFVVSNEPYDFFDAVSIEDRLFRVEDVEYQYMNGTELGLLITKVFAPES